MFAQNVLLSFLSSYTLWKEYFAGKPEIENLRPHSSQALEHVLICWTHLWCSIQIAENSWHAEIFFSSDDKGIILVNDFSICIPHLWFHPKKGTSMLYWNMYIQCLDSIPIFSFQWVQFWAFNLKNQQSFFFWYNSFCWIEGTLFDTAIFLRPGIH